MKTDKLKKYAKYSRIAAFFSNNFIFLTVFFLVTTIITNPNKSLGNILFWINIFLTLYFIFIVINGILFSKHGGDIGKVLCGITVKNGDGTFLSTRDYLFREFVGKFFSTVYFNSGYIYIFFNKKAQGFHDLLTESYVFVKNPTRVFGVFTISLVLFLISLYLTISSFSNNRIFEKIGNHIQVLEYESKEQQK